jgi:RNA polymerase-binding transcription factor DksA
MQLLELRSEMEEDFSRLLRSMTEEQAYGSSVDSDAWSEEPDPTSADLDALVKSQSQARLTSVAAALRRLDAGVYGVCARCGRPISYARLSVMPEATLCAVCSRA